MDNSKITTAFIQRFDGLTNLNLQLSLDQIKSLNDCKYLLVIQSIIEKSIKLTVYPVNKSKIIKVSLFGLKLSKKTLKTISKILQKYEVIHSSGILKIKNSLTYECYLNLSLTEKQSEDLNSSLNKIKNIFKQVKIEEVGLISS
ncbi:MAG: hypothetical protein ACXADU_00830 [Promethearchaeota archaeon]|jgi:hypothetical protein